MRAYLALGSNLGDRWRFLREAVRSMHEVVAVSHVYETEPVGGPIHQGPYLNIVVELETDRSPHDLLGMCRRLESAADRVRAERNGPRTLDVDVLLVGDLTVNDADLTKLGSVAAAREAGKYRLEGKDYVFADGDVALFRFNN